MFMINHKRYDKAYLFVSRYELMTQCWSAEPNDRPSFIDTSNSLEQILRGEEDDDEVETEHTYVNLDAPVDVYIAEDSRSDSPDSTVVTPDESSWGMQPEWPRTTTTVEHADMH